MTIAHIGCSVPLAIRGIQRKPFACTRRDIKKENKLVQWLTPVILASWEAEIERIVVAGQPRQKNFVRPHLSGKNAVCACHPRDGGKLKIGEL
jgi:hypothetical protein